MPVVFFDVDTEAWIYVVMKWALTNSITIEVNIFGNKFLNRYLSLYLLPKWQVSIFFNYWCYPFSFRLLVLVFHNFRNRDSIRVCKYIKLCSPASQANKRVSLAGLFVNTKRQPDTRPGPLTFRLLGKNFRFDY